MPGASDNPIHYIPIITTLISLAFTGVLLQRYRQRGYGAHLLWWAAGAVTYGLGTALEASITLLGNSVALNKVWYIAGALLGGYPLAQGTVYMLLPRRRANILTACTAPLIVVLSLLVVLSPVRLEALDAARPSGAILEWQWIRAFTPLVNGYAAVMLIGLAIRSAIRFMRRRRTYYRMVGNWFIAIGAILPGIGGGMAKAGIVEGLYIGEFVGIILIWVGYRYCQRGPVLDEEETPVAARAEVAARA
jgi:hypothetical protein